MAHKLLERVEAHYEAREVPFGKIYEWHPALCQKLWQPRLRLSRVLLGP